MPNSGQQKRNGIDMGKRISMLLWGNIFTIIGTAGLVFIGMRYLQPAVPDAAPIPVKVTIGFAVATLFGLGLIFTGNPILLARLAYDGWKFRNTQAPPGVGRRHYDPPLETAPPESPMPLLPPRTGRQNEADLESFAADKEAEQSVKRSTDGEAV
jgi:hypothetical protein